jgi:di/tricarboxylate transporter
MSVNTSKAIALPIEAIELRSNPDTFFDALVAFPPYNAHPMRDIGVFTLGVAGALLAAVKFKDTMLVALIGASTAAIVHVVSHIVDSDKGGNPTDIPLLVVFAAILVAGTALRLREVRARKEFQSAR